MPPRSKTNSRAPPTAAWAARSSTWRAAVNWPPASTTQARSPRRRAEATSGGATGSDMALRSYPGFQPVCLSELRVLRGQHLREVDHHPALLPGRVVLHLAVDHVHAPAVRDRVDHLAGEDHLVRVGGEDLLGDVDLGRVQRPRADAAHQERGAELRLAAGEVADVAERPVVGQDPGGGAGVDHAPDRVVPEVLLGARPGRLWIRRIGV